MSRPTKMSPSRCIEIMLVVMGLTVSLSCVIISIVLIVQNMKSYKRSVLVDWNGKSGSLSVLEDGSKAYLEVQVLGDMEKTFEFKGTVYEVNCVKGNRIYLKRRDN